MTYNEKIKIKILNLDLPIESKPYFNEFRKYPFGKKYHGDLIKYQNHPSFNPSQEMNVTFVDLF